MSDVVKQWVHRVDIEDAPVFEELEGRWGDYSFYTHYGVFSDLDVADTKEAIVRRYRTGLKQHIETLRDSLAQHERDLKTFNGVYGNGE